MIGSGVVVTADIEKIANWLLNINPGFEVNEKKYCIYNHNCGSCALAVDRNLEGNRKTLAVSTLYSFSDADMEKHTEKICKYMERSEIERYLKEKGPGSHLIVGIERKPVLFGIVKQAGHWFNAYFDGSQIVTVDGQSGKITSWPPKYGSVASWCAMIEEDL